ncbi:hypothetical protein AAAU22_09190 [[Clostridium] symbiosum]
MAVIIDFVYRRCVIFKYKQSMYNNVTKQPFCTAAHQEGKKQLFSCEIER